MDSMSLKLKSEFPGRADQIEILTSLISQPHDCCVPFIYINGHAATGKTRVITRLFDLYQTEFKNELVQPGLDGETKTIPNSVYIDCTECIYPKVLFRRALKAWLGLQNSPLVTENELLKCETVEDFIKVYNNSPILNRSTKYLILDNAEKLRDLEVLFLPALLELTEITSISIVMISTSPWENLRPLVTPCPEPIALQFTQYTKEDILNILKFDCPKDEPVPFFSTFVDSVYETFRRSCLDLNELRQLVSLIYPKYVQPVFEGQATRNETARLFKLCQPYFVVAIDKLHLREISSYDWQEKSMIASAKNDFEAIERSIASMLLSTGVQELPYLTKYILISAFISSYNPPKLDLQYFAKTSEKKRRVRRGISSVKDPRGGKRRQQLVGPKAFPLSRMLAIFYKLLDFPGFPTVDVYTQISSLVTLKLLIKNSAGDGLDNIKYKCNFSLEFALEISKSVGFEIGKFLYDFS